MRRDPARRAALSRLGGERGQSSVEAAVLVPALLLTVALLVQPACLLYTRSVMSGAAAESARLAATAKSSTDVESFARRRLKAVPEVSVFHVGGEEDWSIAVEGVGGARTAKVRIRGHARPLPLMAAIAGALAGADGEGVVMEVEAEVKARADWVEGSYGDWIGIWG